MVQGLGDDVEREGADDWCALDVGGTRPARTPRSGCAAGRAPPPCGRRRCEARAPAGSARRPRGSPARARIPLTMPPSRRREVVSPVSRLVAYICPSARASSSSDVAPSVGNSARPARRRSRPWRPPPGTAVAARAGGGPPGLRPASFLASSERMTNVTAHARDRVAGSHDRFEPASDRLQDGVAGAVAAEVVDLLEAVEVDEDERERAAGAPCACERLLDAVLEERAVRQARQGVAQGERLGGVNRLAEPDRPCGRPSAPPESASARPLTPSARRKPASSAEPRAPRIPPPSGRRAVSLPLGPSSCPPCRDRGPPRFGSCSSGRNVRAAARPCAPTSSDPVPPNG